MTPKPLACLCLALLIAGCTTQAPITQQPPALPDSYTATGVQTPEVQWWQSFDDKVLEQLINDALSNNFSLKAAVERLKQSEALAQKAGAGTTPSLSANADGGRTFQSSGDVDNFSVGLMASYEVDLWSRLSATEEAARFDYLASREELETAAITLSSEVASTWFELMTQSVLVRLYEAQTDNLENQLQLIELRYRYGQINGEDVLQQKQLLENLKARQLAVENQTTLLTQQLALLTGQSQLNNLSIPDQLPELNPLPATGIPSELAAQRPDLKQAWYQVQSQQQNLIVAEADRLPQIQLTASLISSDASLSNLLDEWVGNLAGSLTASLVDGGARNAEITRQKAALNESLNNYHQSVLEAFTDIESALTREQAEQQQLDSIDQQLTLARQAEALIQARYENGDNTFLEVLTAQNSRLDLEQQKVLSQGQLFSERISLHRALAGSLNFADTHQANGMSQ